MQKRYVWLNLNTGEFSNSWDENSHNADPDLWTTELLDRAKSDGWKLIEYTCLNDPEFEFYQQMKIK